MAAFPPPPPIPPDPPACYGVVQHDGITHEVADATGDVTFSYVQTDGEIWISVGTSSTELYVDDEDGDDEAELGWPHYFDWPPEVIALPMPEEVGVGSVAKARLRYPVGVDNEWGVDS